jgi:hypothetical protein
VGWVTNYLAVQMIFYPVEFRGVPLWRRKEVPLGLLGWQVRDRRCPRRRTFLVGRRGPSSGTERTQPLSGALEFFEAGFGGWSFITNRYLYRRGYALSGPPADVLHRVQLVKKRRTVIS